MTEINFLICARGSAIDRFSNSLSIFDIFESLTPESFPILIPRFVVIASVTRDEREEKPVIEATLKVSAGDRAYVDGTMTFTFHKESPVSRSIAEFQGLPITGPSPIDVFLKLPNGNSKLTRIAIRPANRLKRVVRRSKAQTPSASAAQKQEIEKLPPKGK
ncbi:MAG TPA: hypothetical protein VGE80_09650 [Schlesneria sp.]